MTRREVRCTSCGVLNGVPRYSIRRIPQCGKCHTKLPEPNATKFIRNIYAIPRMVWLAIPVVGLIVWGLQHPTTTKVGKDSFDPAKTPTAVIDACAGRTQPRQGVYRWYVNSDDVANFTIKTASGSNYFVKLEDAATGAPVRSFFVRGGATLTNQVPLGTFILKYASGKSWCNEADLFGSDTATRQADELFTFERRVMEDAYSIRTSTTDLTVELILQLGGNLRTRAIPRSQF